jgi:Zn-dependent protease with chaperone function
MGLNYPAGPQAYPEELIKATAAYRRHAWAALLALLSFVVFYLSLSSWFIWKSYALIRASSRSPNDGFWLFCGGLAAGFIALFMLKAVWFVKRSSTDGLTEVKQDEQPELFAFLYRLADDARAPRPRKVFLSARVNAAVFYDLTLLNLVFPSRKNLEIGLPLVNVLNASEFKAVLAHEFGHFAQRSMAVGRWVYIAQQIAGHVVAKRDILDHFLNGLSRVDVRVAWVGWILSLVVWSIRAVVDTFFKVVLAAERALSREMEFQADRVSVSLTGSDALINALYRFQSADAAWDRALAFANAEVKAGRVTADLFEIQTLIIVKLREILDDMTFGDPAKPNGDPAAHRIFERQTIQGSRMWASHPLNHEREANAKQIYLSVPLDEDSAWALFRNPEALKLKQCANMVASIDPPLPVASRDESLAALELEYGRESYKRIYRGRYLSRPITRHAAQVNDLYGEEVGTVAAIYPDLLQSDLRQLDVLQGECAQLTAVKDGTAKSLDGLIHFRGDAIKRKDIDVTLRTIGQEIEVLNDRIVAHDRLCRTVVRAQALKAGAGWDAYLHGLLSLVHYTEHMHANIADAHGALANVVTMVTAKSKVTDDDRIRIVNRAADLYRLLQEIDAGRSSVSVDEATLKLAGATDWSAMLEAFTLGAPGEGNIGDWIKVIDGWVQSYNPALMRLRRAALDQMLVTESRMHAGAGDHEALGAAPAAPSVPAEYPPFVVGQERSLQKKLDWWSRFQVADGWVPGTARFLVAGGLIGGLLGMTASVGTATLWIHNGLDRAVTTRVGEHSVTLSPGATDTVHLDVDRAVLVSSRTIEGKEIESFKETPDIISGQYVYNVSQASPLVEWTIGYGNSNGSPAREVNDGRWFPTSVQVVLAEPPNSIRTKGGGDTRSVLSAPSDTSLRANLGMVENSQTRNSLILAHARWDAPDSANLTDWLMFASGLPEYSAILQGRLADNPLDIVSLRAEQNMDVDRPATCQRQTALATRHPENADMQYIAVRCMELGPERDAAFNMGNKKYPDNGWFAYAVAYDFAAAGKWSDASKAYQVAIEKTALSEQVALDFARVRRIAQGVNANMQDLMVKSSTLRTNRVLETSEGMSDGDPAMIYFELNRGQVNEAAKRWKSGMGNERALRLIAASVGAPADLIERSLMLAPNLGIDSDVFWSALGLALRHQRNADPLLTQLNADQSQAAQSLRKFVEIMQTTRDAAQADKSLENLQPQMRAQAYVLGVIVLGLQAPAAWREFAKKALFVSERPYLG